MEFNLDDVIESYRSADVIEVKLPKDGTVLKFESVKTHTELVAFKKRRETFQKVVSTKSKQAGWEELTPIPSETATKVFTVSELSLDPKISQLDALKLAKHAPFLLEHIIDTIEQNSTVYLQEQAAKALEEGKEE